MLPWKVRVYMKIFFLFFVSLLFNNSALAENQKLCDALYEYVRATTSSHSLRVKLINDWSSFSKQCLSYESSAAEVFCKPLISYTSTEFMKLNLISILECANADITFKNLSIDEMSGRLSIYEIPKINENIEMIVTFSFGYSDVNDFIEISTLYEEFN